MLLRLVHFEKAHRHFILVNLTTRLDLIPDINVAATTSESLLQQDLIIRNLELVGREAQFVILQIFFFALVSFADTVAIGALWGSTSVIVRSS